MLKLYFGSVFSTISTLLAVIFTVFFALVTARRASISHWGLFTLAMFILGLLMSMMSGMKDGMGSPSSVIPVKHWVMTALCVLGGLAFLSGLLALIIRNPSFWQVSFYLMSAIIVLKVLLTEIYRIVHYLNK
jgi:hypothetical protein